jgi:DNA-binding NarL/FixJ family response regulator
METHMKSTPIRVVIADTQPVVHVGLTATLEATSEYQVVASTAQQHQLLNIVKDHAAHLVISDHGMLGIPPIDRLAALRRALPGVKIILFSARVDLAPELLQAGAHGYVAKTDPLDELHQAIWACFHGQQYISSSAKQLVDRHCLAKQRLRPQEIKVMKYLAYGLDTEQVAEHIGISCRTVQNYIAQIREKTGCRTRVQIAAWYQRCIGEHTLPA